MPQVKFDTVFRSIKIFAGLAGFFFLSHPVFSQSLENIRAVLQEETIVIYYDLVAEASEQKYDVELYSSWNNYASPLQLAEGDVGKLVAPGRDKAVVWRAKEEMRNFQGDIDFEVRAQLAFSPIKIDEVSSSLKAGKTVPVAWKGGLSSEKITLNLYKDGRQIQKLGDFSNTGTYEWAIPKDYAVDGKYSLSIAGSKTTTPIRSREFVIKKGLPLGLKLAPLALVGAGVYFLVKPGTTDPGGGNTNTGGDPLPSPPAFPDN